MDYQIIKFSLGVIFLIVSPYIVVKGIYLLLKADKNEKKTFAALSHIWIGLLLFAALLVYIFLHI